MEKSKQVGGGSSSSSSLTLELFGPKEPSSSSSSSSGLFGSVFGPPSTGLGRDSSHHGRPDLRSQYGNVNHGISDMGHRGKGEGGSKDKSSIYQSETVEPCYLSSSIYYGGQEVYSPPSKPNPSQHVFNKYGGEDDSNGNNLHSASRGNWWQGSLYY